MGPMVRRDWLWGVFSWFGYSEHDHRISAPSSDLQIQGHCISLHLVANCQKSFLERKPTLFQPQNTQNLKFLAKYFLERRYSNITFHISGKRLDSLEASMWFFAIFMGKLFSTLNEIHKVHPRQSRNYFSFQVPAVDHQSVGILRSQFDGWFALCFHVTFVTLFQLVWHFTWICETFIPQYYINTDLFGLSGDVLRSSGHAFHFFESKIFPHLFFVQ